MYVCGVAGDGRLSVYSRKMEELPSGHWVDIVRNIAKEPIQIAALYQNNRVGRAACEKAIEQCRSNEVDLSNLFTQPDFWWRGNGKYGIGIVQWGEEKGSLIRGMFNPDGIIEEADIPENVHILVSAAYSTLQGARNKKLATHIAIAEMGSGKNPNFAEVYADALEFRNYNH